MAQVRSVAAGPRHAASRTGRSGRTGRAGLGTAGVVVGLAGAAVNALAYVVPLLGARALPADGLSALASALAIGAIATVPGLGLQTAIAVGRARDGTVANAARLTAVTALVATGALLAATPLVMATLHLPAAVPLLLAVTTAAVSVASRWLGELQGAQRFGRLALGMTLLAVGRYGGVIAGLAFGAGVVGSLATGAGVAVACLPVLAALARRGPVGSGAASPAHARAGIPGGANNGGGTNVAASITGAANAVGGANIRGGGSAGRTSARSVVSASGATLAMLAVSYADLILARHLLPAAASGSYAVGAVLTKGALWAPQVVTVIALPLLARGSRRALLAAVGIVTASGVALVLASRLAGGLAVRLAGGPAYAALGGYAAGFAAVGALYALVFLLVNAEIARGARWPGAPLWAGLLGLVVATRLLHPPTLGGVLTASVCTAAATAVVMLGVVALARMRRPARIDDVRRDWTTLGSEDPLWAVLTLPGKRGGQWDIGEFLATGRADVDLTMRWLRSLGLADRFTRALDFGCGVGRLSQALAAHADAVVGVDISPPMLATARDIDRSDGACSFVLNDTDDLGQFPDGQFDLVYCALVLQHLPRPAIERYLAEFMRVLRPGGVAVVQVPTKPLWTVKGLVWRVAPRALIGWAQRRFLGYPAPMAMTAVPDADMLALVDANGGEIVGRMTDPTYTEDWLNTRYALRRR